MKFIKAISLLILLAMLPVTNLLAQCAMCRATLETNVSNGSETVLAANLNFGILYLFAAPYVIIAAVGFFWYKRSQNTSSQD